MFCSKQIKNLIFGIVSIPLLLACGEENKSDDDQVEVVEGVCGSNPSGINWQALETEDCSLLSQFNLFGDPTNPTTSPNGQGTPYDLTTPLFTDYASKYRFVFIPEGKQATYSEQETIEFPVGTVLTKTFSLPTNTSERGFNNETLIETRLLIHRQSGWVALPYIWNEEKSDAELKVAGGQFVNQIIVHEGETLDFTYAVPDKNQCKQCHQLGQLDPDTQAGDDTKLINARFSPIGPKARYLNKEYTYDSGAENQLAKWIRDGLLAGAPSDLTTIDTAPMFEDDTFEAVDLAAMSQSEIEPFAKSYLDINCAHCHRPEGGASNTGFHVEYWRAFNSDMTKHGLCKTPIANGGNGPGTDFDLVPGDSDASFITTRMASTKPGMKMPELGRTTVHKEGVELIAAWINAMDPSIGTCN